LSQRFTVRARGLALAALAAGATTAGVVSAPDTGTASAAPPKANQAVSTIKAKSTKHVMTGRRARIRGKLAPATAGRKVGIQVKTRRGWKTVAHTTTRGAGRFRASWKPRHAGRYRLRVHTRSTAAASAASANSFRVNAYRGGKASWYGPGLYGNKLGCGGTLNAGTVGVANKSLPCGTKVTFRYRGRSVAARVVDRGPYAGGRDWDLTAALKRKLGFPSTGVVWSTR
jgi:rare lipoprotein A